MIDRDDPRLTEWRHRFWTEYHEWLQGLREEWEDDEPERYADDDIPDIEDVEWLDGSFDELFDED